MGLWSNNHVHSDAQVKDIKKKSITKQITVGNNTCEVTIMDAQFGEVDGKEVLLDIHIIDKMISDIARAISLNTSKYNAFPKKIRISRDDISNKQPSVLQDPLAGEEASATTDNGLFETYMPRYTFEDIYIDQHAKEQILTSLAMKSHAHLLFNEWGLKSTIKSGRAIILNFYGPPGTGKSMAAEAIASYLHKEIYCVNYSQLESKYVGETPKNIKKVFALAREKNAVLVFDEADSFLGKRLTNVSQSADYGVNITRSVMLLELERFDGIVVFTTNLLSNYDDAFRRRILSSVEFMLPDKDGRKAIWETHIPKELPLEPEVTCEILAERYDGISGADIKDIVLFAAIIGAQRKASNLKLDDFEKSHTYIKSRYANGVNLEVKTEIITQEQYAQETGDISIL
ncbi:MAG: ATPase [Herbinix sp.]|jgi:SpoVK/Ycf46/Vps4 family AAA+-type ATPase|nr:ATPase [Herbinix sp.]